MKTQLQTLVTFSALAIGLSAQANVSLSNIGVGSSTSFPSFSISGGNGSLFLQSVIGTSGGTSIPGGVSQGFTANNGFGEIFNYTGASGSKLGAISIVEEGGGGTATFQPFLLDLGTTIYNTTSSTFNPSLHANLLSTVTLTPSPAGSANFLEFDFSGTDAITLVSGESYAFGLLNNNNDTSLFFERSGGGAADPNGDGFTLTSLSATTDNASPYAGAVRTQMIGVYTTTVPEPSSFAFLGFALALFAGIRRRKA